MCTSVHTTPPMLLDHLSKSCLGTTALNLPLPTTEIPPKRKPKKINKTRRNISLALFSVHRPREATESKRCWIEAKLKATAAQKLFRKSVRHPETKKIYSAELQRNVCRTAKPQGGVFPPG